MKRELAISKFSGADGHLLEKWITDIEDAATIHKWDDLNTTAYAKRLVEGDAKISLRVTGIISNWSQLKGFLREEFEPVDDAPMDEESRGLPPFNRSVVCDNNDPGSVQESRTESEDDAVFGAIVSCELVRWKREKSVVNPKIVIRCGRIRLSMRYYKDCRHWKLALLLVRQTIATRCETTNATTIDDLGSVRDGTSEHKRLLGLSTEEEKVVQATTNYWEQSPALQVGKVRDKTEDCGSVRNNTSVYEVPRKLLALDDSAIVECGQARDDVRRAVYENLQESSSLNAEILKESQTMQKTEKIPVWS